MKISKEVRVGILALITMAVFFWLFRFLQGENLFSTGRVFYVKYHNVDGLLPTKPVNVNGLRIGRVDDIIINEQKDSIYFIVKMTIEEDLSFTKNTVAEIYEPGLLAGKMIQLNLSYEGELAQDGDTLVASNKASLMSMVSNKLEPTQNRLDSVLVSLNDVLANFGNISDAETDRSLKNVLKSLNVSIEALGSTARSLESTSDNANTLFIHADDKFDELTINTNRMLTTTNSAIGKYGLVADKLNKSKLDETLSQLNEASIALKSTLYKINDSNGSLNKLITNDELYNNLNKTSENLNVLVEDFQLNPDRYVQFSIFGKKPRSSAKKDEIIIIETEK